MGIARMNGACGRRRGLLGVAVSVAAIALVLVGGCASGRSTGLESGASASATTAGATDTTVGALASATTSAASTEPPGTGGANDTNPQGSVPATDAASEIREVLDTWCGGVNNHNLDQKISTYADVVSPFFGETKVTKAEVRKVFARPFAMYKHMSQRLERIDIKVKGDSAVARVYKTRVYDGHPGWAEERLGLARTPDGWRIVSEQDIRASN
jgi:ketosteroid isomerase-like protein